MKRAVKDYLEEQRKHDLCATVASDELADILDSDARQRAEIRRLRAALREVRAGWKFIGCWVYEGRGSFTGTVDAALRPAKATR